MNKLIILWCGLMMAVTGFSESGTLTLEQAMALARANSPELRAVRMHADAAEKAVGAAGLWDNPKLQFEAEGVGGELDLFSDAEYTLGLKQNVQMGGKREKGRAVALRSVDVARQVVFEKELELACKVRAAFIEVMAQQETGKVRAEQEQLGLAFVEVAKRRYDVGGGSELEVVEAELALEEILLSQTCCFGDLLASQSRLASLLGVPLKEVLKLIAPYYELETLEAFPLDESHPSLQRLEASAEKVRAEAQQALAQDTSDILLGAGYKHEAAEDINTFVFSASIPLGLNRKGRVEHAAGMVRLSAVQADREEARRKLQGELAISLALYNGSKMEAEIAGNNLMKKAEQAYALSREGYEAGRFSWMELISAQQHLAEIRIRHIEALRDAHLARARIAQFMQEGI